MLIMGLAIKIVAAVLTVGWVYSVGKEAGEKEVLTKMGMFAEGMKAGEQKKNAKEV
jgi:hypothetical protein